MATNFKEITNQRLHKLLEETQQTLTELKTEMERREQVQQHHEIDEIDQHMEVAENSLTSIKEFFRYLLETGSERK